jgi:hypothetical protein
MKHISVLVAENAIVSAVGNIYHLFQKANDFLVEKDATLSAVHKNCKKTLIGRFAR